MAGISCGFMPLGGGNGKEIERNNALRALGKIFSEIDSNCDGFIKVEAFIAYLTLRYGIVMSNEDKENLRKAANEFGEINPF